MIDKRIPTVALGLLVLAGCSASPTSAPPLTTAAQLDSICADVGAKVGPLPSLKDLDDATHIVPMLDTQLAAAQDAQRRLGSVLAAAADRSRYSDFQAKWAAAATTLGKLRDTWHDPYVDSPGLPESAHSDSAAALSVYAAETDARRDTTALRDAATRAELSPCATIAWHTDT
ncbi:hypothetical protein [Amycolatopsis sp. NPDC051372]|uniref:hypothetical protein n=1 Tax=unclassified Amycolatopsis TaxID=2618356 RepID=UPI00344A3763